MANSCPAMPTYRAPGTVLSKHSQHIRSLRMARLAQGPSPSFQRGETEAQRGQTTCARDHKANETDRMLLCVHWKPGRAGRRPCKGAHSPTRGSAQARLTPGPHLSAALDNRQGARDKPAKEEIRAAESTPPGLWEGRVGLAPLSACPAPLGQGCPL